MTDKSQVTLWYGTEAQESDFLTFKIQDFFADRIEKEGWCVGNNGRDSAYSKIVNLGYQDTKEKCWEECVKEIAATGCEWSKQYGLCHRHTVMVPNADSNLKDNWICLVFGMVNLMKPPNCFCLNHCNNKGYPN